jgi:predicted RNA-binding Zn-ribbon protein involved in translation (DUF1610 family)
MGKEGVDAYDPHLVAYVWRNYLHLFSPAERQAESALIGEGKIGAYVTRGDAPAAYADVIRETFGSIEAPETKVLLSDGVDVFYRRACERVLRDHSTSIVINRCPNCGQVVISPESLQCLSCHYDWHPNRKSIE